MTAPLLIHFEHLPPTGEVRVRVDGDAQGLILPNRATAQAFVERIVRGKYRIIDGLGPRQRTKQRRLPR